MPFQERKTILTNLKFVDEVMGFEDDHLGSCIKGLMDLKVKYPCLLYTSDAADDP